jgi:phosphoenolpyruvate carboxykinase (ATP)
MLGERLEEHDVPVWLINTGWSGGGYGVGERINIAHTRNMVRAALDGALADVPVQRDAIFGVAVPEAVPGVPGELLQPRATWSDGSAYDAAARQLAGMFVENFRTFEAGVSVDVAAAGPDPDGRPS